MAEISLFPSTNMTTTSNENNLLFLIMEKILRGISYNIFLNKPSYRFLHCHERLFSFYLENVTCMSDDVCVTFFVQILLFTAILE